MHEAPGQQFQSIGLAYILRIDVLSKDPRTVNKNNNKKKCNK